MPDFQFYTFMNIINSNKQKHERIMFTEAYERSFWVGNAAKMIIVLDAILQLVLPASNTLETS